MRILVACILALLVTAALVATAVAYASVQKPERPPVQLPRDRWAVVGTGLAAATVVYYMAPPLRAATSMREASTRFGGRILTAPKSIAPMNTVTQALELGAWTFDAFGHTRLKALLLELQITTYLQVFYPAQSFTFYGCTRRPWPEVPVVADANQRYADVAPATQAAWLAHTGIGVADAPDASVNAVWNTVIPITAAVVTGLGWQAVPTLQYTSGDAEDVQGVVLACGPADVAAIAGVTADALAAIRDCLVPVTQGVLYGQWAAKDVWWPQLGVDHAVVATDTYLGRVCTADAGTLRCKVTGQAAVTYWTDWIVKEGMAAAATAMAAMLATVFGVDTLPPPAFVSFRGWPNGLWLWKAGVDPAAARRRMVRPCGPNVPVWWACADISDNQGWAEGAVEAGLAAAAAVNAYVDNGNGNGNGNAGLHSGMV